MTQIATVERILSPEYAEVSVPRKSACGHDCEECAGCGVSGAAVHARASHPIGARPGQKVVVETGANAAAGAGFVLGILLAIRYDRRLRDRGGLTFTIVRLF